MEHRIDFGLFDFHLAHIAQHEKCSFQEACRRVKSSGCDWVEYNFDQLTDEKIGILRDNGLRVSGIYCFLDFGQVLDSRFHALLETARKAAPKFVMPIPDRDDTPELQKKIIPQLIRLQKALAEQGIQMVMEDFDGPGKSFATSEGLLAMLDAVPGLKCCFDTGNFYYSGEDALEIFPLFADRTVHFHFKDRRPDESQGKFLGATAAGVKTAYAAVGEGILPLREIFCESLARGYQGTIIAELALCHDPLAALQRSLTNMRQWQKNWEEQHS